MGYLMKLITMARGTPSSRIFYRMITRKTGGFTDTSTAYLIQGMAFGVQSRLIFNPSASKYDTAKIAWWYLDLNFKGRRLHSPVLFVKGSRGALFPLFPPTDPNFESNDTKNIPDLHDLRERLELLVELRAEDPLQLAVYPVAIAYSKEDFYKKTDEETEENEESHDLGKFQFELLSLMLEMAKRSPSLIFGIFELSSWRAVDEIDGIVDWLVTWIFIINWIRGEKEISLPRMDLDFNFVQSFQQSIYRLSTLPRGVFSQHFSKSFHLLNDLMDNSRGFSFGLIMTMGTLSRFLTETCLLESLEEVNLPKTQRQIRNALIYLFFNPKEGRKRLVQSARALVDRIDEKCRALDDELNQWIRGHFSFAIPLERTSSRQASFKKLAERRVTMLGHPTSAERRKSLRDLMEEFLQQKILVHLLNSRSWWQSHVRRSIQHSFLFHVSEQWKSLLAQELESALSEMFLGKTSDKEESGQAIDPLVKVISEKDLEKISLSLIQRELILGDEEQLATLLDEIVGFFEDRAFHFLINFLRVDMTTTTRLPISMPSWLSPDLLPTIEHHLSERPEFLSTLSFHRASSSDEKALPLLVSFIVHLIIGELNEKACADEPAYRDGLSFSKSKIADRAWKRIKEFLDEEWASLAESLLSSFTPSWSDDLVRVLDDLQEKLQLTHSFLRDEAQDTFYQQCWKESERFITKLFFIAPFIGESQCTWQNFHENGTHGPFASFFSFLEKIIHSLLTTPFSTIIDLKKEIFNRIDDYNKTKEQEIWNALLRKTFIKLLEESLPRPWKLIPGDVDFPTEIHIARNVSRTSQMMMTPGERNEPGHEQSMSLVPVMADPDDAKDVPFILQLSWPQETTVFPQVIARSCCSSCRLKPSHKDKNPPSFKPCIVNEADYERTLLIDPLQETVLVMRKPLDELMHHLQKIQWLIDYCHVLMQASQHGTPAHSTVSHLKIPSILEQFHGYFGKKCRHFNWMLKQSLP